MDHLNATYWENRYLNNETAWDLKQVSPPLKEFIDGLEKNHSYNKDMKILIPGAGRAYEAAYLHEKGYKQVYVVDIAPTPLATFAQYCPSFPKEHLIEANFFELTLGDFDLVLEQTFFCAIDPSLRNDYVQHMHKLLKKGGRLCGLLFQFPLTQEGPPFGGSLSSYLDLFENDFHISFIETAQNSIKPRLDKELFFIFENK